MSATTYVVGDPESVKRWAPKINREVLKKTLVGKWQSKSASSPIQVKDELKDYGDRISVQLRMQGSGNGRANGKTLVGHGEKLTTHVQNVFLGQLRHMFEDGGKLSNQRVSFNVQRESKDALADWFADRDDYSLLAHLCGYTVETREEYIAGNTILAPSTGRILRADANTTDEALTDAINDVFVVADVDKMVAQAQTVSPAIRPVSIDGKDHYICVLHPFQVLSLRRSDSEWYGLMKAAIQGGKVSDNPIFTGALGVYDNVIFYSSNRIPQGVHSTATTAVANTRRAVLLGAQAACVCYGRGNGPHRYDWVEDKYDMGDKYRVAAGAIRGFVKSQFNSVDFSTIVYSTYAAAPM